MDRDDMGLSGECGGDLQGDVGMAQHALEPVQVGRTLPYSRPKHCGLHL